MSYCPNFLIISCEKLFVEKCFCVSCLKLCLRYRLNHRYFLFVFSLGWHICKHDESSQRSKEYESEFTEPSEKYQPAEYLLTQYFIQSMKSGTDGMIWFGCSNETMKETFLIIIFIQTQEMYHTERPVSNISSSGF